MSDETPGYLSPYAEVARSHGARFEALLWMNRDAQRVRFDATIDLADLTGKTVLDAGCGLADFHDRLVERNVGHARYIGVEGIASLAGAASERLKPFGSRRAEVVVGDFVGDAALFGRLVRLERVDAVVFGGSLNTLEQGEAEAVLGRAWEAVSARGRGTLVFNFLGDRCDAARLAQDPSPAKRFGTLAMLDWAMSRTTRVLFRQDYLAGHDATIVMVA